MFLPALIVKYIQLCKNFSPLQPSPEVFYYYFPIWCATLPFLFPVFLFSLSSVNQHNCTLNFQTVFPDPPQNHVMLLPSLINCTCLNQLVTYMYSFKLLCLPKQEVSYHGINKLKFNFKGNSKWKLQSLHPALSLLRP